MALVRKGSRRIVVDGTAYRWRLRRRPTYSQGLAWSPCTFAVEHADAPGTTLVVTTNQPHPSNWVGREAKPVLPADVAEAIRSSCWLRLLALSGKAQDLSLGITGSSALRTHSDLLGRVEKSPTVRLVAALD